MRVCGLCVVVLDCQWANSISSFGSGVMSLIKKKSSMDPEKKKVFVVQVPCRKIRQYRLGIDRAKSYMVGFVTDYSLDSIYR